MKVRNMMMVLFAVGFCYSTALASHSCDTWLDGGTGSSNHNYAPLASTGENDCIFTLPAGQTCGQPDGNKITCVNSSNPRKYITHNCVVPPYRNFEYHGGKWWSVTDSSTKFTCAYSYKN